MEKNKSKDNNEILEKIKERYKAYEAELKEQGKGIIFDTEAGIYGATDLDTVFEFFRRTGLEKCKSFVDLGSGDGRVVLAASLFTKATGIEADPELCDAGKSISEELVINKGLDLQAKFICRDFLECDLTDHDIVYINPDKDFFKGTEAKLIGEMRKESKLFVYNFAFMPDRLKKGRTFLVNQIPITEFTNE